MDEQTMEYIEKMKVVNQYFQEVNSAITFNKDIKICKELKLKIPNNQIRTVKEFKKYFPFINDDLIVVMR